MTDPEKIINAIKSWSEGAYHYKWTEMEKDVYDTIREVCADERNIENAKTEIQRTLFVMNKNLAATKSAFIHGEWKELKQIVDDLDTNVGALKDALANMKEENDG